jgi:hypothetical protein
MTKMGDPITAEDVIEAARAMLLASDQAFDAEEAGPAFATRSNFYDHEDDFRDLLARYDAQQKEKSRGR